MEIVLTENVSKDLQSDDNSSVLRSIQGPSVSTTMEPVFSASTQPADSVCLLLEFIFFLSLVQFLRIHHYIKFLLMSSCSIGLSLVALQSSLPLYYVISLWVPMLVLIPIDRDQELTSRMEWVWREKLRGEEEQVETMQGINRVLLENLLPSHVAHHFLSVIKGAGTEVLYSQKYDNVHVMFASIPNYKEFYNENDINKQGLECIRLLNEIICDFDLLLSKPKYSSIEKIKTIGSSYMVAAGLTPGHTVKKETARDNNIGLLVVEFVFQMMQLLENLNRDSFQNFSLRVGASMGPVVAGVVGARKPQYDIWGNTVNVASRMETSGQMGRIQVTESFATALKEKGVNVTFRGNIQVKGKGSLPTYWLDKPNKLIVPNQ